MPLTKLTQSVDVVQTLSDRPNALDGLDAAQLKAKFDEAANIIKAYLNNVLIPELEAGNIDIIDNYVTKIELSNNRKLSSLGNFTGSWHGIANPTFADPGIANVVNQHTTQLAETVKKGDLVIDVRDYGAVGDGIKDDTEAILNAIFVASSVGGGRVFLPDGDFLVSSTIKILTNNITLFGSGRGSSRIVGSGNVSPVLQIGDANASVYRFKLSDFSITRKLGSALKTGTIGFHYVKSAHSDICEIENCSFNGSQFNVQLGTSADRPEALTSWIACEFGNFDQNDDYAMYVLNGIEQKFVNCRFQGFNLAGFIVPGIAINPNDFVFTNCYFGSTSYAFGGSGGDYGVRITKGFAYFFNSCIFEQGKNSNILIEGGKIFKFSNCMVGGAGHTGNGIHIIGSNQPIVDVSITGCEIRDFGQANSNMNGTGRGVYIEPGANGVSRAVISAANVRNDTGSQCIRYDVDFVSITGCSILQNRDFPAILATANADTATISGCVIDASGITTAATSPITLSSGSGGQVAAGNSIIKGGATNGITNSGDPSNVVANNAIV